MSIHPADWTSVDHQGAVAVLAMARAPGNVLCETMCQTVAFALQNLMAAPQVQAVVLASQCPSFSQGVDARAYLGASMGPVRALNDLCALVLGAQKPVIAAIAGPCFGAGLRLALACSARVGSERASFGFAEARFAMMPPAGSVYALTHLVGAQAALEIMLQSAQPSAQRAYDIGLLDVLAPDGQALAQAMGLAQQLPRAQNGQAALPRRDPFAHARADLAHIAQMRADFAAQAPQNAAILPILAASEAVYLLPPPMAHSQEALAADALRTSDTARALTYASIAEAQAVAAQPDAALAAENPILLALRREMGKIVAYFETEGLTRPQILGAVAAYGIAVPQGATPPPCPVGAQEVMPALNAAWANLGARALRTGQLAQANLLDGALLRAGMFVRAKGGPLYIADMRGALVMRAELARRARTARDIAGAAAADIFTPDPLWDDLVSGGGRLGALYPDWV